MKILIATLDDRYFLPKFYDEIIKALKGSVVGICLFETKPKNTSYMKFLRMQLRMLRVVDFMKVLFTYIRNTFTGHTIVGLVRKYDLPIYRFESVNSREMKDYIERNNINVLLCNLDEIIKDTILDIEGLICVNRHFSLLPKYGGLYPLYWALKNKEEYCGITIHKMTNIIDGGEIIEQHAIRISEKDTYLSLTKKCFEVSGQLMIKALNKIKNGERGWRLQDESERTYFSNP
jgi:methionyl-tRNA formyltransferase